MGLTRLYFHFKVSHRQYRFSDPHGRAGYCWLDVVAVVQFLLIVLIYVCRIFQNFPLCLRCLLPRLAATVSCFFYKLVWTFFFPRENMILHQSYSLPFVFAIFPSLFWKSEIFEILSENLFKSFVRFGFPPLRRDFALPFILLHLTLQSLFPTASSPDTSSRATPALCLPYPAQYLVMFVACCTAMARLVLYAFDEALPQRLEDKGLRVAMLHSASLRYMPCPSYVTMPSNSFCEKSVPWDPSHSYRHLCTGICIAMKTLILFIFIEVYFRLANTVVCVISTAQKKSTPIELLLFRVEHSHFIDSSVENERMLKFYRDQIYFIYFSASRSSCVKLFFLELRACILRKFTRTALCAYPNGSFTAEIHLPAHPDTTIIYNLMLCLRRVCSWFFLTHESKCTLKKCRIPPSLQRWSQNSNSLEHFAAEHYVHRQIQVLPGDLVWADTVHPLYWLLLHHPVLLWHPDLSTLEHHSPRENRGLLSSRKKYILLSREKILSQHFPEFLWGKIISCSHQGFGLLQAVGSLTSTPHRPQTATSHWRIHYDRTVALPPNIIHPVLWHRSTCSASSSSPCGRSTRPSPTSSATGSSWRAWTNGLLAQAFVCGASLFSRGELPQKSVWPEPRKQNPDDRFCPVDYTPPPLSPNLGGKHDDLFCMITWMNTASVRIQSLGRDRIYSDSSQSPQARCRVSVASKCDQHHVSTSNFCFSSLSKATENAKIFLKWAESEFVALCHQVRRIFHAYCLCGYRNCRTRNATSLGIQPIFFPHENRPTSDSSGEIVSNKAVLMPRSLIPRVLMM